MIFKVLIVFCALVFIVICDECEQTKCSPLIRLYNEIGCIPENDEGKCCPSRFVCPNFTERDNTKCYFQGETYEIRKVISVTKTRHFCLIGCRCLPSGSNPSISKFYCADIMCIEFYYPCIGVGDVDSCCATEYICDYREINKLGTCLLNGRKYYAGQRMHPENSPCNSCYCSNNFNNSTIIGNEYCRPISCKIELESMQKILDGCIPIYFGLLKCCPFDWKCPSVNDKIIKNTVNQSDDSIDQNMTCKYGAMVLQIGDGITDKKKCVNCKCHVPPMAHCVIKELC